jgi:hypothetical protein
MHPSPSTTKPLHHGPWRRLRASDEIRSGRGDRIRRFGRALRGRCMAQMGWLPVLEIRVSRGRTSMQVLVSPRHTHTDTRTHTHRERTEARMGLSPSLCFSSSYVGRGGWRNLNPSHLDFACMNCFVDNAQTPFSGRAVFVSVISSTPCPTLMFVGGEVGGRSASRDVLLCRTWSCLFIFLSSPLLLPRPEGSKRIAGGGRRCSRRTGFFFLIPAAFPGSNMSLRLKSSTCMTGRASEFGLGREGPSLLIIWAD